MPTHSRNDLSRLSRQVVGHRPRLCEIELRNFPDICCADAVRLAEQVRIVFLEDVCEKLPIV
jgi:hypothetical protein